MGVGSLRLGIAFAGVLVLSSATAHASSETERCVASHYEAQQLRNAGQLIAARELLLRCTAPSCPGLVRQGCAELLADVQKRQPTVVFAAKDATGADCLDVSVSVDGQPVIERLDGRAVPIDAGPHKLVLQRSLGPSVEQTILVNEGEKDRIVRVTFAETDPGGPGAATRLDASASKRPPEQSPGHAQTAQPRPWAAIAVMGGLSVLALSSFGYFGITGQTTKDRLEASCRPSGTCSADEVSGARTQLVVADVSLVVGLVSAGIGLYLYLRHPAATAAW